MTIDVEAFSIPVNKEDLGIVKQVHEEGLPLLLNLFSKYDIEATFYFTGTFAEQSPESIELVKDHGHEVGCHGYDHSPEKAFDILSYEEQVNELKKAKQIIEEVAGKIVSFRAPALRINEDTVKALEVTGFETDSSVCPQRFDWTINFNSKLWYKWLIAPRRPYMLSYQSFAKKGRSKVVEIPISTFFLSYMGVTLRTMPTLFRMIQKMLFLEAKIKKSPVVFLYHPSECLTLTDTYPLLTKNNIFSFKTIKNRIKLKRIGKESLRLVENVLRIASTSGFEFTSVAKYKNYLAEKKIN